MLLYIAMGFVPFFAVSIVKKREKEEGAAQSSFSWPYIVWLIIWVVFAVGRYVGPRIGGTDAPNYIRFFDVCLEPSYMGFEWGNHIDLLYALLNKAIRYLTDDYHILFLVIYAILVISYILVVNKLGLSTVSYVPLIFLVFIFIRGFSSIRSNLAAALILFSVVFFFEKRYRTCVVLAISSVFVHKMAFLYLLYLPVMWWFRNKKMSIVNCAVLLVAMGVIGLVCQFILTTSNIDFFESGSYSYYAGTSLGVSFFDNYWKIAFPQLLLFVAIAIFNTPIQKFLQSLEGEAKDKGLFVYKMSLFDISTIPATFILGIWRGYEFLCIFRLLMWGIVIEAICSGLGPRQKAGVRLIAGVLFIAWMVFRQYNTFEDTSLMPYIFAPFVS